LVDHFAAIHRSHAHTLRHFGLPEPTRDAVRRAVGLGLEHAILQLLGPKNASSLPDALTIYREYWTRTMLDDVAMLPHAIPLLQELREAGVSCAVLTNKHGASSRAIADHLGFAELLDAVIGADDTPWLKPDARLTSHALAAIGGNTDSALFVGDSAHDVTTALNAGLPSWVVTTGTHSADELRAAGAGRIFDDLSAVRTALGECS